MSRKTWGSTTRIPRITTDKNGSVVGVSDVLAAAAGGPASQLDANGTTLDVNVITDGEYLKRVGTTVVSGPGGSGTMDHAALTSNLAWTTSGHTGTDGHLSGWAGGSPVTRQLDTDGTLAANSDTRVPSQKAVKTYADTKAPKGLATASGLTVSGPINVIGRKSAGAGAVEELSVSVGGDVAPGASDAAAGTGSLRSLSNTATTACAGNDSRLSDARTPTVAGEADGDILYRTGGAWTRLAKPAGAGRRLSHDGSVPAWWLGDYPIQFTEPPAVASLSWVNQSPGGVAAASAAKLNGQLVLSCLGRGNGAANISALLATATSLDVIFEWQGTVGNWTIMGACWYETATGKLETIHVVNVGGVWSLRSAKYNSVTSFNADRTVWGVHIHPGSRLALRLLKSGTNLEYQLLGVDASGSWVPSYLVTAWAQNNFFTTGPDKVGIFVNPQTANTTYSNQLRILHWVTS